MKTNTIGGSAVASGGYGCIFRPMIPCNTAQQDSYLSTSQNKQEKNSSSENNKDKLKKDDYVSKLMLHKHANVEINEVMRFHKILQDIPNYEEYFIFPKVACTPSSLTNNDKIDYDKKCSRLNKHGISVNNVNKHLMDLTVLQIPDGGIDVHDYIDNHNITKDIFYKINRNLIRLLKYAIVPMNNKNLYHLDLKAANVLVDTNNNYKVKLIDWGMSSHIKSKNQIPDIGYRPFHFNMPYSIILMNTETITHIEKVIYENYSQNELTVDIASDLIERYYTRFLSKKLGDGHLEYIEHLSKILHSNDKRSEFDEIFTYLAKIIVHFRRINNTFNYKYFEIFLHNIDIWGFISIYLPFMDLDEKFIDKHLRKLKATIRKLYTEFLYKYVVEPIPLHKLINFLESLNKQYYPVSPSTKIAYVDTLLSKTVTMNIDFSKQYIKPKSYTRKRKLSNQKSKSYSRKRVL